MTKIIFSKSNGRLAHIAAILLAVLAVLFASVSCTRDQIDSDSAAETAPVSSFAMGKGLPEWRFSRPMICLPVPEELSEKGAAAMYTAAEDQPDSADVTVFRYPKTDGMTLSDFAAEMAGKYGVNLASYVYEGTEIFDYLYFESGGAEERGQIVSANLCEADDCFVDIEVRYRCFEAELGSGKTIVLPKEYSLNKSDSEALFPDGKNYLPSSSGEHLPEVFTARIAGDALTADHYDAEKAGSVTEERFSALCEDGWTAEELIELYGGKHELLRGDIYERNGLDVCFIAYIEDGILYANAFLIDGDGFLLIGARDEAEEFSHIVNTLVDSVR